MFEWADDLKLAGTGLYLDSRRSRRLCFVSHAHSDHLPRDGCGHDHVIATPATAALVDHRVGVRGVTELPYRAEHHLDPDTRLTLLPAGHVFGSAMAHVSRPEGTLLYTGDFKLRPSRTVEQAEVRPADVLVMESTYGQPFFRFPPWEKVAAELVERVEAAFRANRQPVVMGYSLGKAQEATKLLTDAGFTVTLHGAPHALSQIHTRLGVPLGRYRRYAPADFHGAVPLDLRERGVLIAPPHVARSPFVTRFKNPCRIVLTGWALLKNAPHRYGADHALPLSDHADFDELLELIDRVRPKKIFTHHGPRSFVDLVRSRGLDAAPARPDAQLSLFD